MVVHFDFNIIGTLFIYMPYDITDSESGCDIGNSKFWGYIIAIAAC